MSRTTRRKRRDGATSGPSQSNQEGMLTETRQHDNQLTGTKVVNRCHKKELYLCTYNPQSISDLNQEDLDTMLIELQNMKWDVIGLSGSQIKNNKIETVTGGHYLFNSGNEVSRSNGVGFLVHKSIVQYITDYKRVSDRLATLTLQNKDNKIVIIQTYLPTSQHPDEEVDQLYDEIQKYIDATPTRDLLFLMGDFNAKVGQLNTTYPSNVGIHTIGENNERGVKLAKFCSANNLYITNTHFKKRKLHTWNHPNGRNKNQIDFIITRKQHLKNILDSEALNTPSISDHRLVRTKVDLNIYWKTTKPKRSQKFDINELITNHSKADEFKLKLNNRFAVLTTEEPTNNVEEIENQITTTVLKTASEVLPPRKQPKAHWMTSETMTAIEKRKEVRQRHGDSSVQYKVAKAESKKLVKRDKRNDLNDQLDRLANLTLTKQFFMATRKLKTNKNNISWGLKDKDGNILTTKEQIQERWASFYEDLYSCDSNKETMIINYKDELEILMIIEEEIRAAIKQLNSGKSSGMDEMLAEFFKYGGEELIKMLKHLFNRILQTNEVPENFKKALIVVLYKKDDRAECKNYRPISLLSHTYKLFMTIIGKRISKDLYSSFSTSQAAYQPGRNTLEQIFAIERLFERSTEFNTPIHAVFIDFSKAFDSIKLDKLWNMLDKTCINKNYINLLKKTYEGSQAMIKTDLGITRIIQIKKGIKQGDVLSAILFCIALSAILAKTEEETGTGYSINGHIISNLAYADDLAALNSNINELQNFVNKLAENAEEIGLKINLKKTVTMTTDKHQPELNIKIYGKPIKQVTQFIYLGHKISATCNSEITVKHRIGLGWAAFGKNEKILKSKRVPLYIKKKIYDVYILPVILYGADCITWTPRLTNQMEVFQNDIMRILTGYRRTDKIRIEELRKKTKFQALLPIIKSRTLKMYGHVKRSNKGYSKICLEGFIPGTRTRGKPKTRFQDNILKWSNCENWKELNTICKDRTAWKQVSHVETQSATGGRSV